MKFLLDTNAISEPQRAVPDEGYLHWLARREPDELAISALSVGELSRGVALLAQGKRRTELTAWLAEAMLLFGDRILPVDVVVARIWAEVWVRHRQVARPVGVVDELTAATALAHGLAVVTRNVRHFENSGCEFVCPWSA